MTPRFRIDVRQDGLGWEATVYDFDDHGPDLPYATVSGGDLGRVIDSAAHYVIVASPEQPAYQKIAELKRRMAAARAGVDTNDERGTA